MPLPTKPTAAVKELRGSRILIHGDPKIGKSTWCAQLPNHLILDTEDRLRKITAVKQKIDNFAQFKEVINELSSMPKDKFPYEWIVIDTLSALGAMYRQHILSSNPNTKDSSIPRTVGELLGGYGKGQEMYEAQWRDWIIFLTHLPCGVVFTAHTKEETVRVEENGVMVELEKRVPEHTVKYSKTQKNPTDGLVDSIFYFTQETAGIVDGVPQKRRVIRTGPSNSYVAGNSDGLPPTIDMSVSAVMEAYKSISK